MHSVQLEDQNDTCLLKDSTVKLLKINFLLHFYLRKDYLAVGRQEQIKSIPTLI